MAKKLPVILCILLAFNLLFAENEVIEELLIEESIESQILNFEEVKPPQIFKGRKLLLAKFLEGDLQAVREVKDYLLELEDKLYLSFHTNELHLLWLWTEEYEHLLPALQKYDNEANRLKYSLFQHPSQDLLYNNLLKSTEESKEQLQKQIQRSALNFEEQTFLLLFLDWILAPNRPDPYLQQTFNERVDEFLKEFPQSKFETFVRSHIRNKQVPETWGWGMGLFSGGGILTGNLQKEYTNPILLFGFVADVYRRNLALYLRLFTSYNSKTKKAKPYALGVWEKGSKNNVSLLEMSLGYTLYDGNWFKITPFAGIGSQEILPNPIKSELEEFELRATTAYILGANLDIKFRFKSSFKHEPVTSFKFLRIRYGYSVPQFAPKYPGMSGNMHYINVGSGFVVRDTKREY